MLETLLGTIPELPAYLLDVFERHTVFSIVMLVVFLFSLIFSNKVAYYLRMAFVIVVVALGAFGFYRGAKNNGFFLFLSAVLALLVMIVVRLISTSIRSIRQRRIDARIEERALEKAAKRRGNFKNKQGYSGEQRPIVDDEKPAEMTKEEIHDVVKNELSDEAAAAADAQAEKDLAEKKDLPEITEETLAADEATVAAEEPVEEELAEKTKELLNNLESLLNGGILSQEEFDAKKAELLKK